MMVGSILSGIWSGVEGAVVAALNAVIAAVGYAAQSTFDLLPEMPSLPAIPSSVTGVYGWVAWVFPVSTIEDILAWATTMWVLWFAVSGLLRWAKLERGAG